MKLIIGLGNPGAQYARTRHNVGHRVVDKLANTFGWPWSERRGRAVLASGMLGDEKIVLAKPTTYMNLSGEAISELVRWYKVAPADILVIYDELDLPVGKVRLRARGQAAGHNGMRDIIHHLHTNAFPRLRVGISHPTNSHVPGKDHVLGIPTKDEAILLATGEDRAVEAVRMLLAQGLDATMNVVNTDPEEAARKAEEKLRRQKEREEKRKAAENTGSEDTRSDNTESDNTED